LRLQTWSRELETLHPTARDRDLYAALIRREYGLAAALATAEDWQSPSFGHSLRSQAGRHEGRIRPYIDDYKRDRHADAAAYEAAYLREYVRAPGARAFATSCGMSALTTFLAFLGIEGPVVLGRSSYHETKELVLATFAGRVVQVDETDLVDALERFRPKALFVDSLCNSRGLAVPDLGPILDAADCWVVVDNTCLGPACRPFESAAPRLLVWESLLKLAQFGLDRANAGILLARGPGVDRLNSLREHLGTNVPDTSILSLPAPNRARLERRLARLERNAAILAELEAGGTLVDGLGVGDIGDVALRDRRMLSADGIFIVVVTIAEQDGHSVADPEVIFRGVPFLDEADELVEEIRSTVEDTIKRAAKDEIREVDVVQEMLHDDMAKLVYDRLKRRPMVLPVVVEV